MKINNTLDELLFAATHGLEPDDEDLGQVRVPAGEDASTFLAEIRSTAQRIVDMRKEGRHGDARALADETAADYLRHFEALLPIPAGRQQTSPEAIDDNPTSLADLGSRMFRR